MRIRSFEPACMSEETAKALKTNTIKKKLKADSPTIKVEVFLYPYSD